MSIADRVEAFVSNYYRRNGDSEFGDEYQQIFANEGSRKASYVLQDLKGKQDEYGFHLRDLAYLSIGGADGSEAEAVLKECDIPHAVVLEIDTPACDKARERRESLLPKKLDVFEGDAVGNLDKAIEAIKSRGAKGLIVSAQAILHELPSRSASFSDFDDLFGKLLGCFPIVLLYTREPCRPVDWPERVEIMIPGVEGERLKDLMTLIGDRLRLDTSRISVRRDNYVACNAVLTVETLHKLLRSKSIANFKMEMGEQLTSFDVEKVRDLLMKHCGDPVFVESQFLTTQGFKDAYVKAGVKARHPEAGKPISFPSTHARIIAVAAKGGESDTSKMAPPLNEARSRASASVRRGKLDSEITFSTVDEFPRGVRVAERSAFTIADPDSNPYFQFGGSRSDILKIFKLNFSLQLGAHGPTNPAPSVPILNCKPQSEAELAKLLADVTEEKIEGESSERYIGLKRWVPLEYIKAGVQVVIEADYVVQKSRLFTWRVGVPTEGYDLTIHYPSEQFDIQIEPFINWSVATKNIANEKRYRSDELVRPENGVAWCFSFDAQAEQNSRA